MNPIGVPLPLKLRERGRGVVFVLWRQESHTESPQISQWNKINKIKALSSNLFFTTRSFCLVYFSSIFQAMEFLKYRLSYGTPVIIRLQFADLSTSKVVAGSVSLSHFQLLAQVIVWYLPFGSLGVARDSFLFGPRFIFLASDQNYTDILSIFLQTWLISIMLTGEGFCLLANFSIQKGEQVLLPLLKHSRYSIFELFCLTLALRILSFTKCNKDDKMKIEREDCFHKC